MLLVCSADLTLCIFDSTTFVPEHKNFEKYESYAIKKTSERNVSMFTNAYMDIVFMLGVIARRGRF